LRTISAAYSLLWTLVYMHDEGDNISIDMDMFLSWTKVSLKNTSALVPVPRSKYVP
jgi:hypothetical protein